MLAAAPPPPPVLDCADRVTGASVIADGVARPYRFAVRPEHDRVVGPVAFVGLRDYARAFDAMVARDQWLKSIALVRPHRRVTLVVPREERAWLRLEYGGPGSSVTLKACKTILTPFMGGFTIDYAHAPDQGRGAELIVRPGGRVKLFS